MTAKKKKTAKTYRFLNVRLTVEEYAELAAYASSVADESGRPMPTSTWARVCLLRRARGQA